MYQSLRNTYLFGDYSTRNHIPLRFFTMSKFLLCCIRHVFLYHFFNLFKATYRHWHQILVLAAKRLPSINQGFTNWSNSYRQDISQYKSTNDWTYSLSNSKFLVWERTSWHTKMHPRRQKHRHDCRFLMIYDRTNGWWLGGRMHHSTRHGLSRAPKPSSLSNLLEEGREHGHWAGLRHL